MKITYWSDIACPYCYIGETNLKTALKQLGMEDTELEMRSYELHPGAPKESAGSVLEQMQASGQNMDFMKDRIKPVLDMATQAGLEFHYEQVHQVNTRDAHRLLKAAQAHESDTVVQGLIESLFKAYFTDGLVLTDPDVLRSIALSEGMNPELVEQVITTNDYDEEVKNDEMQAQLFGVRGVPYFLIGKYYVPGALSVEQMVELLKEVRDEEQNKFTGMSCGPNGCDIM